jgi:hypothetical protein
MSVEEETPARVPIEGVVAVMGFPNVGVDSSIA